MGHSLPGDCPISECQSGIWSICRFQANETTHPGAGWSHLAVALTVIKLGQQSECFRLHSNQPKLP
jgi:hypothetical protein